MLVSWAVVLVAVLGLVLWLVSIRPNGNPDLALMGKILFFCGVLVTCMLLGGRAVRVL